MPFFCRAPTPACNMVHSSFLRARIFIELSWMAFWCPIRSDSIRFGDKLPKESPEMKLDLPVPRQHIWQCLCQCGSPWPVPSPRHARTPKQSPTRSSQKTSFESSPNTSCESCSAVLPKMSDCEFGDASRVYMRMGSRPDSEPRASGNVTTSWNGHMAARESLNKLLVPQLEQKASGIE